MAEINSYENGTPCWVDIGTSDLEGAVQFYSDLFGWEIEIGPAEMGHYSNATIRGKTVAALADQQQPGAAFWATYLAVDNLDESVAKVVPAGGTVIVEPMDVAEFGRMAVILDPGGAQISLWQAGDHLGAQLVNETGTVCWNELMTRNHEESIAFFEAVVGLTAVKQGFDGADYYEFRLPSGRRVAGLMPMIGDMWPAEIPDHWMVYFAVDDTDQTAARCVELGGVVSVPPNDIPPGSFAILNDPQGAHFSVIKMTEPPD
jgi:uncharacterized protein